MLYLQNIGAYFLMIVEMFRKPTKWSVMRQLILKDIDDLIIGSLGIVAFISFFVGGVVAIQTALNISNPLIPDRKSTRLNSSHVKISYALLCLKKKTT